MNFKRGAKNLGSILEMLTRPNHFWITNRATWIKMYERKTGLNSTSISYLISQKLTYSNAEEKVNVNVSTILVFNHRRKSSDQNRIRVQVSQLFWQRNKYFIMRPLEKFPNEDFLLSFFVIDL